MPETQTYANHARLHPVYHFFIFPVSAVTVLLTGWSLIQYGFSLLAIWSVIATIAACMAVLVMRTYAMKVQDRVIRLEERLRLATLLSEPLKTRIGELTVSQLIALRFASDAEIPALVEKALNEELTNPQIKKQIATGAPITIAFDVAFANCGLQIGTDLQSAIRSSAMKMACGVRTNDLLWRLLHNATSTWSVKRRIARCNRRGLFHV